MGARRLLAGLLAALAVPALLVADVSWWARRDLVDSERFASRAREALETPEVRTLLTDEITERAVAELPAEARPFTPRVRRELSRLVASAEFAAVFEDSVVEIHGALVASEQDTVVLDLSPVEPAVARALADVDPRLEGAAGELDLADVPIGDADDFPDLGFVDDATRVLALGATVAAVGSLALGALLSTDRARFARAVGLWVAAGAGLVLLLVWSGADLLLNRVGDPDVRAAGRAVFDALLGGLRWQTGVVGAAGLAAAVAGHTAVVVSSRRARAGGAVDAIDAGTG